MPTTNKRINLTISDNIYERLTQYKEKNGITSDASACLQLIVRQLDSIDNAEKMMQLVAKFDMEQLKQISDYGTEALKLIVDSKKENS